MKFKIIFISILFCTIVLVLASCRSFKNIQTFKPNEVYTPINRPLYDIIVKQDSALFEAFNSRNITRLKLYFADNLEVYQDNTGLRNYKETVEAFTDLFKLDYVLTRKPIIETFEVYPIKNYGAIETGKHTFCHTENGKLACGTFKFTHIWENKNGLWKIAKIITYDHKM